MGGGTYYTGNQLPRNTNPITPKYLKVEVIEVAIFTPIFSIHPELLREVVSRTSWMSDTVAAQGGGILVGHVRLVSGTWRPWRIWHK